MSEEFPTMLSPYQLGHLPLKNRVVSLPHGMLMTEEGIPTSANLDHFRRLSSGGLGLIITGGTAVHPSAALRRRILIEAYNPKALEALQEHVEVVKQGGARIVGQLLHLGREVLGAETLSAPPAPSALKSPRNAYAPHELHKDEIQELVDAFAQAAHNLESIGYDGIEVHAAHGYLVAQFLSPATNHRFDEYGGSLHARLRFLEEIVRAVRRDCSPEFVLGVRLSADEELPNGLTIDDSCEIARHLGEIDENVDYLNVTVGVRGAYVKDSTHEDGLAVPAASRIKEESGLAVLVSQRIRDPYQAEEILQSGSADLIGLTRAMLADPEWLQKAASGHSSRIRHCIGVNQDCRAMDPHVLCAVNPETGRPASFVAQHASVESKVVWVIGGGPAGLEAARNLALSGHRTSLFERTSELGGQVLTAARSPFRSKLSDLIDYQAGEVRRLGVDVHMGAEVGADAIEDIVAEGVDAVIVATGSKQVRRTKVSMSGPPILGVDDVLLDEFRAGSRTRVVVYDEDDGFWPAYSAAEKLSVSGCNVTIVTTLPAPGARIPYESVGPLQKRLSGNGVRFLPHYVVTEVADRGVTILSSLNNDSMVLDADLVVWHAGRVVEDELWRTWKNSSPVPLIPVGDCIAPRRIGHAVFDGYEAAKRVSGGVESPGP